MKDALHYSAIMGFGYVVKTLEIDLSGSPSNEAQFILAVTQDGGPEDTGAEIMFDAKFDSHLSVSSSTMDK